MRHGETQENGEGERHSVRTPLSEKGCSQAESVAKRLGYLPIDLVVSSHFTRAYQTAEFISRSLKREIAISELLGERKRLEDPGGTKKNDPGFGVLLENLKKNFDNPKFHHDKEETFYEFKTRIEDFLRWLEMSKKEQVLVVTHSDVVRMVACVVIFGSLLTPALYLQAKDCLKHKNTGVTVIEKDNKVWSFVTWNDHAHLN